MATPHKAPGVGKVSESTMPAGRCRLVYEYGVKIPLRGKATGTYAYVSPCDVDKIIAHGWTLWSNYANNDKLGKMHTYVMGAKPEGVPEGWVVDHINRIKLDNKRSNLRWVTPSFNGWNKEPAPGVIYVGVRFHLGKWVARFHQKHFGCFDNARDAGKAVAKAAIDAYGDWAETSDLIARNFSSEEIEEIKKSKASPVTPERKLPVGVRINGRKFAVYRDGMYQGAYDSVEEADAASKQYMKDKRDKKWRTHLAKEIPLDADGHAVIALTGNNGIGKYAKVPTHLWHELTFKHPWNFWSCGYAGGRWEGTTNYLHYAVWKLLHPEYVPIKGFSIDHRIPGNPLNNLEDNLRILSIQDQHRNMCKKGVGSYVGVSYNSKIGRWKGGFKIGSKVIQTPYTDCQHEAALLLNALRVKHLGEGAILNEIVG